MTILQIVPRLPPSICGVGDYAWLLAEALQQHYGIASRFLVADPVWQGSKDEVLFPTTKLIDRSAAGWKAALDVEISGVDGILLQFSGYGYSEHGAPSRMVNALHQSCMQQPHVQWFTMFHELFAPGPWWTKAFWVRPFQKRVCRKLAQRSTVVRTNLRAYANWLERHATPRQRPVPCLPVFSNLGELADPSPPSSRPSRMVLFQPPSPMSAHGERFWKQFVVARKALQPDEVIVAGRTRDIPREFNLTHVGVLSRGDATALLATARFGFLDYYDGCLGKSGIFAAFAAHGVACVLASPNDSSPDGVSAGTHFLPAREAAAFGSTDKMNRVAQALHRWYSGHNRSATAQAFANQLRTCC